MTDKLVLEFQVLCDINLDNLLKVQACLESELNAQFQLVQHTEGVKVHTSMYISQDEDSTLLLKHHIPSKLFTIDLDSPHLLLGFTFEDVQDVAHRLLQLLPELNHPNGSPHWQQVPILKLGRKFNQYLTTSDGRLMEYGLKDRLFHKTSECQSIDIYDTLDHGRILVLDGQVNLAEGDTIQYTECLLGYPKNIPFYQGANILILGGGDGGLLKSLLNLEKPPCRVTMVEIDLQVMKACSQFMPSICEPFLSQTRGSNFQIIHGDAFDFIGKAQTNSYDAIISDLTDVPLAKNGSQSKALDLCQRAFQESLPLLNPGGKYLTHCNGKSVPQVLAAFEQMLKSIGSHSVTISQRAAFVPSFHESWVFFEINTRQ